MIKKNVVYEDYDGNQKNKDLWFHLNKSDLAKLNLKYDGGLMEEMKSLQEAGNRSAIAEFVDELLVKAYGERMSGSDVFKKTPEIEENFRYSAAHDELLMMLLAGDDDEIIDFIVGIMPGLKNEDRLRVIAQVKDAQSKKESASTDVSENA